MDVPFSWFSSLEILQQACCNVQLLHTRSALGFQLMRCYYKSKTQGSGLLLDLSHMVLIVPVDGCSPL
jgi:hypothetical protein